MAYDCSVQCAAGDEVCRGKCFAQATTEDEAMAALASCEARSCASACGLQCGGWGVLAGPYLDAVERSASCRSCVASMAICEGIAACIQDTACLGSRFCLDNCEAYDGICTGNCAVTSPVPAGFGSADSGAASFTGEFYQLCEVPCQLGTDWSCVGTRTWPVVRSPMITVSVFVQAFPSGSALAGATVQACERGTACSSPVGSQVVTTDATGRASLQIPTSYPFDGYFQVSADGYVTALESPYPYLTEATAMPGGGAVFVALIPSNLFQMYVEATGAPFNSSLGTIFLQAQDCTGTFASGVSFTGDATQLGPSAKAYYLVDNIPSGSATQTQRGNIGGGGFVNVSPGLVRVDTTYQGTVVSSVVLQVRAGALTEADPVPNPP